MSKRTNERASESIEMSGHITRASAAVTEVKSLSVAPSAKEEASEEANDTRSEITQADLADIVMEQLGRLQRRNELMETDPSSCGGAEVNQGFAMVDLVNCSGNGRG